MQQENKQQLNNDYHAPPYTDERNPLTNNARLKPKTQSSISGFCFRNGVVGWLGFLVYVGGLFGDSLYVVVSDPYIDSTGWRSNSSWFFPMYTEVKMTFDYR